MGRGWGKAAARVVVCLAGVWSSAALAQTSLSRNSSFAYQAGSGLLTQEVIEPNTSALRLQTDYTYNAFGHRTQVTVSGIDIAAEGQHQREDGGGQLEQRRRGGQGAPCPTGAAALAHGTPARSRRR